MTLRKMASRITLVLMTLGLLSVPQISLAASSYQIVVHVPSVAGVIPADAKVTLIDSTNLANQSDSRLVGTDSYGWFGVVDVPADAYAVRVVATGSRVSPVAINPSSTRELWLNNVGVPSIQEYRATLKLKVSLVTRATLMSGRSLKVTIGKTVKTYNFAKSGSKLAVSVPVATSTSTVKFTVLRNKVAGKTYTVDVRKAARVWVGDYFTGVRTTEAWANNQVKIHYRRADASYDGWGVHAWSTPAGGGTTRTVSWDSPIAPDSVTPDAWGITYTIPVTATTKTMPFIIHNGDQKDPSSIDQILNLAATKGEVWFESGRLNTNNSIRYTIPVPMDAAPTLPQEGAAPSLQEATSLATDSVRSAFAGDNIYFVLTDRYKNGNTANDRMGLTGNRDVTAFDPTSTAYYHGGDLVGLTDGCTTGDGVARLKAMGFTSVWLTPPFKQRYVQGGSAAYHGYWITDFTDIDPHLGTKADFKDFVDCLHSQGMKVVMDIVVNHTGDVNDYPDGNYDFGASRPVRIASSDAQLRKPDFLNDPANYHNRGNVQDWNNKEQSQNGDFFGLDDVYTEKPAVVEGFAQAYAAWVNDYDVDGFRIDTAKHVDDAFFTKWWPRVLELTAAKKPNLFAYGEVYDSSTSNLTQFVRDRALPSVLDFAFQNAAVQFATGNNVSSISAVFDADDWYITNKTNAYNQVTFLGNHDMGRFGQLLKWAGDPVGDLWGDALVGYDLMYMARGIPNVYYGDENGIIGTGGDQAARQDMFATSVNGWKTEARIAANPIGSASYLAEVNHPIQERITALNQLRNDYPALKTGSQIKRYASNGVLAFSRFDLAERREFVVAINNTQSTKTGVTIQTSSPLTTFTQVWGQPQTVTSDANGLITISVADRQAVVLRAASVLPAAESVGNVVLTLPQDAGVSVWKPKATIANWSDPSTCTFVIKVNGGAWQVLGVDDSFDWKMILDGNKYPNGAKLTIAAIVKTTSGAIGVSNAIQVTNNR